MRTFADNNKKQLTRSKSKKAEKNIEVVIPAKKREEIMKEKDEKKQKIKARIESKVSPSKLEAKAKKDVKGGRDKSLNREIQHAMNNMAQVMKAAFEEDK